MAASDPWWMSDAPPLDGGSGSCMVKQLDPKACQADATCSYDSWKGVCLPKKVTKRRAVWGTRWTMAEDDEEMEAEAQATTLLLAEWKKYKCWVSTTMMECARQKGCYYSPMANLCLPRSMKPHVGFVRYTTAAQQYLREHAEEAKREGLGMTSRKTMLKRAMVATALGWTGATVLGLPTSTSSAILGAIASAGVAAFKTFLVAAGQFAYYAWTVTSTVLGVGARIGSFLTQAASKLVALLPSPSSVAASGLLQAAIVSLGVLVSQATVPKVADLLLWVKRHAMGIKKELDEEIEAAEKHLRAMRRALGEDGRRRGPDETDHMRKTRIVVARRRVAAAMLRVRRARRAALGMITWGSAVVAVCGGFALMASGMGVGVTMVVVQFLISAFTIFAQTLGMQKTLGVRRLVRFLMSSSTWMRLGRGLANIFKVVLRLSARKAQELRAIASRGRDAAATTRHLLKDSEQRST